MEELFYKLKKIYITKYILVILLGILFFSLGIVLSVYVSNLFLVAGVCLCMLESVIIFATKIKKNNSKDELINNVFSDNIPYLKNIPNSTRLSKAYNLFDLNNISYKYETLLSYKGESNNISVSISSLLCKFNGDSNDYFVRLYTFEAKEKINVDVNSIKNKCLINYRYEIIGNRLYIISSSKGARGKVLSLYPKYYKRFEQWVLRIKDEELFFNDVIKAIGGSKNEKANN